MIRALRQEEVTEEEEEDEEEEEEEVDGDEHEDEMEDDLAVRFVGCYFSKESTSLGSRKHFLLQQQIAR